MIACSQEDSVLLWKAVCSNKLLANVDLVLFLNKCDILEAKLNSGVRYVALGCELLGECVSSSV